MRTYTTRLFGLLGVLLLAATTTASANGYKDGGEPNIEWSGLWLGIGIGTGTC